MRLFYNYFLLTIIILSWEESEEWRQTLAILGIVEIVAPTIECSEGVGVVTGRVVLLLVTLTQGLDWDSGHHPGHVNVGQTIGELVHIDMDAVDAVLRLHLSLEPGLSGSEINTNETSFKFV